ncbi:MAG: amidohydrolase family protein [Paracoccaceae bacterium]|nr:amidohydrolase family protein [Paracoccaceae bacterium]
MKIDAHHHLWHPARGDYGWMPKGDPVLDRPYTPADLRPALKACGIGATVLVQAAPTVAETDYLLGLAEATDWIAGVVGWIDFEDAAQSATLHRLARHPKLKGIRPMIQDIPDDGWMLRDEVHWAFRALAGLDLAFDALGFPRHLDAFAQLMARHPDLRVVIDHGMKPAVGGDGFAAWARGMTRLAKAGAYVKLSGLLTEAAPGAGLEALRPYVDHILTAFTPARVMWGSDWPVLRLRAEYEDWHAMALSLTDHLTEAERARIFGGTAAEFYRLAPPSRAPDSMGRT